MTTTRAGLVLVLAAAGALAARGAGPGGAEDGVVRVRREPACPGEISPMQYGQFVEYLCDLVPGMWAEKLYDGSFEGLTPYKVAFLKQTDFREKPWYPSGATNRAEYAPDPTCPVSGDVAQKIAASGKSPCTVGLSQDGVYVENGKPCIFRCFLKQQGLSEPVQARLHRDGRTVAVCSFRPTGTWTKFRARLTPEQSGETTLSISFRGPGTLWLDNASLMPEDTVGGWRPDVVEALRALRPAVIRFGGSTLDDANLGDFRWQDTVGDPDRRRPFRAWGGLQPTGPGLEEFVSLCRAVGAEPLVCVRVSRRSPRDAAEQVEYFNGPADSPMGKQRAHNGHPEPYRIKYWQVGNERSGQEYESRLAEFCRAMKAVDPTIQLLSSYPTPGVLRTAGRWLGFVCPHHYDCADLAGSEKDLLRVRAMVADEAPGRPIKIAVTEWNTTGGDWGTRRARLWTLENALACSRYHNLLHRHADLVEIANRSNLTNSFCSGIIQTDRHRLYKTPTYYAQQLYATRAGCRPVQVEAGGGPDVSATLTRDGNALVLFVVNDGLQDLGRTLDLTAFGNGGREIETWTLADRKQAGEPDVTNSFDEPERVSPVASTLKAAGPRFSYRFPALSLTVLRWPLRP